METLLKRFVTDDCGQDLIEYGLLIGIITSAVVGSISAIGSKVQTYYTTLQSNIGA
jgi:Flp pilus assembly pilin Flp